MSLLSQLAYSTGIYRMAAPFFAGHGHILTLHRVAENTSGPRIRWNKNLEITPEYLEEVILSYKNKGYTFLSMDQLHDQLVQGTLQKPFVTFTLDDGYEDNYTLAYPVFKKYDVPFCIYICRALIEERLECWWSDLEDILLCYNRIQFRGKEYSLRSAREKEAAYLTFRASIIHTGFDFGYSLYRELMELYPPCKSYNGYASMSREQIQTLSREPLATLGAHTVHHYPLSRLETEVAREEMLLSKNFVEEILGQPVEHFAYPYGSADEAGEREFQLAAEVGFKTAVTTRIGNVFPEHTRALTAIPRIPLIETPEDKRLYKMSVSGFLPAYLTKGKRVITA